MNVGANGMICVYVQCLEVNRNLVCILVECFKHRIEKFVEYDCGIEVCPLLLAPCD